MVRMEGQKPRIRYSSLLLGCALLILGLLMPLLLNVGNMEVYTSMYKAFSRDEKYMCWQRLFSCCC